LAHIEDGMFTIRINSNGTINDSRSKSLAYVSWSGAERQVWLAGDATTGVHLVFFVTGVTASDAALATCEADGTCKPTEHIEYWGPDLVRYAASIAP
jgi:hypothetical protein